MKPLTAAITVAAWMLTCLCVYIVIGVIVINNAYWWGLGGLFMICVITFPIIAYNFAEDQCQ